MTKKCCMCDKHIEREDASVLAMGAAGNPRWLCDECEKLLDAATLSHDYDEISSAMEQVSEIMSNGNPDGVTFSVVGEIMLSASERAKVIKEGSYDFALDDEPKDDGGLDEIPEELKESEEDMEKDRIDEEKMKKFDKIYNVILAVACVAFGAFLIWQIVDRFFL